MDKKKKIIIPWDFTEKAQYALEHGISIAKVVNNEIALLHIVDERLNGKKKEQQVVEAKSKLETIVKEANAKYNVDLQALVEIGNIFTTIGKADLEVDVTMNIMGTHGMKGMQKFTGSWALKVIEGSEVPFLVVQAPPKKEKYTDIVFPLDFDSDKLEVLKWGNYFAHLYKCKIHIFHKVYHDKSLANKVKRNLKTARNYLENSKTEFDISPADGKGKFHDQSVAFAKARNADVILITTTKNISTADYILGAPEQQVLANKEKIPVLCINPSKLSITSAVF